MAASRYAAMSVNNLRSIAPRARARIFVSVVVQAAALLATATAEKDKLHYECNNGDIDQGDGLCVSYRSSFSMASAAPGCECAQGGYLRQAGTCSIDVPRATEPDHLYECAAEYYLVTVANDSLCRHDYSVTSKLLGLYLLHSAVRVQTESYNELVGAFRFHFRWLCIPRADLPPPTCDPGYLFIPEISMCQRTYAARWARTKVNNIIQPVIVENIGEPHAAVR
jgi:hypothetical protein